jgi:hypothetical protein
VRRLASDLRIITTVDEHAAEALPDWSIAPSRRHEGVPCARCGAPVGRRESDPSLMLALALLAMAYTVVVAAAVAAITWIVT